MRSTTRAAIGSMVFFVAAPGVVAGLVPWWLSDGWTSRSASWLLRIPGAVLFAAGLAVLVLSFVRFVVEGVGTPAPIAPTRHLVVGGFYRYVRNPMYVAIAAILVGQSLWLAQPTIAVYAGIAWAVTALFVKTYEEPTLRRTFGAEYENYCRNVRAWIPRLTPWVTGS